MVSKKAQVSPDEAELHFLNQLTKKNEGAKPSAVVDSAFDLIRNHLTKCDITSTAAVRSHISPWWRVVGTVLETALTVATLSESSELVASVTRGFHSIKSCLDELIEKAGFDALARDTLSIYSGFNISYTGAVRAGLESIHAASDPILACDLILGLEACLPLDNKGNSNIYKKVRQVDDNERLRHVLSSVIADPEIEGFEEGEVSLEDPAKAFDRFWTMMDVSRRNEPDLLTETKAWGRFSQSATATLSILLDQVDGLEGRSNISAEPIEYSAEPSSFPIQLSSASFRRRAVFNILLTCSYVFLNSSNALITAAAKGLFANVLKSLSIDSNGAISLLMKLEGHWVSWKTQNNFTKEACGPFEPKSRLERGLEPFGETQLDLSAIAPLGPQSTEITVQPHPAVSIIENSDFTDYQMKENGEDKSSSYREYLKAKIDQYRKYVADSILCDISDESLVARLSASDEGLEEAMRTNNDRVLLWQFKRMRFATDLKSFSKHSTAPQKAAEPVDH